MSWTPSALQPSVARRNIYTVLITGQSAFQGLHSYYLVYIPHHQSLRKAASHLGGTEAQKAELASEAPKAPDSGKTPEPSP